MAKHTYRVTLPDGREAKRTTARTYTHVVAVQGLPTDWDVKAGHLSVTDWAVWGWCGRLDLAHKQFGAATSAGRRAEILAVPQPDAS